MKTTKIIPQGLLETLRASDLRMIAYVVGKKDGIGCIYINSPKSSLKQWSFKKLLFLNIIQIHCIKGNVAYYKLHSQYSDQNQYRFNLITGKYKESSVKTTIAAVNQGALPAQKTEHIPLSWGSIA